MTNLLPTFTSPWNSVTALCLMAPGVLASPLQICAAMTPKQAEATRDEPQTPSGSKEGPQASPTTSTTKGDQDAAMTRGEIVADIDPGCGSVFQDKDHNYWFSGGG